MGVQYVCGSTPELIAAKPSVGIVVSGPKDDSRDLAQILKDDGLDAVSFTDSGAGSPLVIFVAHQEKPKPPKSTINKSPSRPAGALDRR